MRWLRCWVGCWAVAVVLGIMAGGALCYDVPSRSNDLRVSLEFLGHLSMTTGTAVRFALRNDTGGAVSIVDSDTNGPVMFPRGVEMLTSNGTWRPLVRYIPGRPGRVLDPAQTGQRAIPIYVGSCQAKEVLFMRCAFEGALAYRYACVVATDYQKTCTVWSAAFPTGEMSRVKLRE
jgi:hypothetical protein